jgi:predicted ATPase/transcriptional regulator with XRE-family HTH domain
MDGAASFGQQLRRRRKAIDITQEELADRVGCARSTIRMIEGGERRPSRQLAALIAEHLRIPEGERGAFLRLARESQEGSKVPHAGAPPHVERAEGTTIPTNLRAEPTRLIGRREEVEEIAQLLQGGARLLTLTGPPGVGKTRLSLAVAAELLYEDDSSRSADRRTTDDGSEGSSQQEEDSIDSPKSKIQNPKFKDGVFFVGLSAISDPELVAPALAQTLKLREAAEPALEVLKEYLQSRRVLLVLDNFEQLLGLKPNSLDAAASLSQLIAECPGLACLVTSREPLHVRGEQQFEVAPLPWPGMVHPHSADDMLHYPSVALFVERAQAVDHSFHLTEENAEAVATLCAHVDGLPLAIELVAARVKLLPPAALVQKFSVSEGSTALHLLSGGARDLPERHRTLRAAIGWSYDLLNKDECVLFDRLGVFAGGYTLNSVEAICNARGDLSLPVLDGLQSLLDKSLLKRGDTVSGEDEPRYTMLEMVREYATERLEEGGEDGKVQEWFLDYYLALTAAARPHLVGAEQKVWLAKLDTEESNIRAALRWATDSGRIEIAARMAVALHNYWFSLGKITEGRSWLEDLASRGEEAGIPESVQIELNNCAGFLATIQYEFDKAARLLDRSLMLSRQTGDKTKLGVTLSNLSGMETYRGNWARSESLLTEALALFREAGDSRRVGLMLHGLALVSLSVGNFERVVTFETEAISLAREAGDKWHTSWALTTMGMALYKSGHLDEAESAGREAMATLEGLEGSTIPRAGAFNCLGEVARGRGDLALAKRMYCNSLKEVRGMGNSTFGTQNFLGLGLLAVSVGEARRATILFSALNCMIERFKTVHAPFVKSEFDQGVAAARACLGEAEWTVAWSQGRAMSLDEMIAFALEETDPI